MATARKNTQTKIKKMSEKTLCEITIMMAELDTKLEEMTAKQAAFLNKSYVSQKVCHKVFGEGVVIEQKEDVLKIHFAKSDLTKAFVIHEKFVNRPIFENDATVIAEFTEFGNTRQMITQLQQEKMHLKKTRAALLAGL